MKTESSATGLLVLLSILAGGAGFIFLSEATMGVGIIGLAALLGIWARIAQADTNHKKLEAKLFEYLAK